MIKKRFFRKILIAGILLFAFGSIFTQAEAADNFLEAIQKENDCISAAYQKFQGALEVARCKCWPDSPSCLRPPGEDPGCPEKYVPKLEQELKECRKITDEKKTPSSLEITQTPKGDFYDINTNKVGKFNFPVKQAMGATVLLVTAGYVVYRKFRIKRKVLPFLIGLGLIGGLLLVSGKIKTGNQENIQLPEVSVSNDEAQKAIDAVAKLKEVQDFKKLVEENGQSKFDIEVAALPTKETPYYLIQVFEIFPDHQTTFAWYRYEPKSEKVTLDE